MGHGGHSQPPQRIGVLRATNCTDRGARRRRPLETVSLPFRTPCSHPKNESVSEHCKSVRQPKRHSRDLLVAKITSVSLHLLKERREPLRQEGLIIWTGCSPYLRLALELLLDPVPSLNVHRSPGEGHRESALCGAAARHRSGSTGSSRDDLARSVCRRSLCPASMATTQRGCSARKPRTFSRVSFFRKATLPSASAPCA